MKLERFTEHYDGREFDLLVIGGGITGATVAYEAALRGLSVALVEKNDYASATSSATSKMIHGGLRYLSKFEFGLVRESLRERRILSSIAPNFIHPMPFIFSMYEKDNMSPKAMKIGMMLYELLSYDKNKLPDKYKKMPHYETLTPEKVCELIPVAPIQGLLGGQLYYDCSSHSPERFTLAFIKSAVKFGAKIANYAEMIDFISVKTATMTYVKGIKVKDKITEREMEIKSKLVINCSGPWADILLGKLKNNQHNHELRRSEGIHIVTRKLLETYVFSGIIDKTKHFFLVPYRNRTLIGTTDKEFKGNPDNYKVTKQSIMEFIGDVNSFFGHDGFLKYEDVLYSYGGLRPLVEDQTEDVYHTSRKYEITGELKNGISGLITVEGGKYTTSRRLAEKAINKVIKILQLPNRSSSSEKTFLYNCEIDNYSKFVEDHIQKYSFLKPNQVEYLCKSYGNELDAVLELMNENLEYKQIVNEDGENLAQVVYACRFESAKTLSDILLRRTGIALLGNPGKEIIEKVAEIAAKELSWVKEKKDSEIQQMMDILRIPQ
jgi:glycerol-3-phosphate dehydrogenase